MTKSESGKPPAKKDANRAEADVAFIEALARILRENDLAELDVTREYGEDDELQVRLSRVAASLATAPLPAPPAMAVPAAPVAAAPAPSAPAAIEAGADDIVTSPMVGTVYLAPEPGAATFVSVGDSVSEGQTVLIVEAMKTMNHIPSPRAGVVKQILVADAQPVEYGAPLLLLE